MKTVIYKCDKCKKVIQASEDGTHMGQVINIFIFASYNHETMTYVPDVRMVAQWCRPCAVDARLEVPVFGQSKESLPPAPTIEDLIRELVGEAVEEAGSGS